MIRINIQIIIRKQQHKVITTISFTLTHLKQTVSITITTTTINSIDKPIPKNVTPARIPQVKQP